MGAMVALPGSDYNLQKDLATFIEIASSVHARLTKRRRTLVCGFVPTVLSTIRKECVVERARFGGDNDMVLISWGEKLSQELADEWNGMNKKGRGPGLNRRPVVNYLIET